MRKYVLIALVVAVVAGACLAAAVTPVLTQGTQTEEQGFVENLIAELLSSQGRTLQVRNVGIGLTGNVTVGHIEVHDGDGAWLTLEGVALDWQPFSLIGDTLVVNELKAERITVLRQPLEIPDGEAPEEAADLGGVLVDRLAIDVLDVASAVMGQSLRLTAQGSMRITQDPRVVSLNLSARHTEGSAGQIDATIDYDQSSEQLAVDITMNEARGGVLTALLPLSDAADVSVRIAGTGRIDDWRGTLEFSVEDEAVIEGLARINREQDAYTLALDLAGAFDTLTPDGLDDLFAGRSELSVATRYEPGSPVQLDQARLSSEAILLAVQGVIDFGGSDTAVTLEARTLGSDPVSIELDALPFSKLDFAEAVIAGRLSGPVDHPAWSFNVRAATVSTAEAVLANPRISGTGSGLPPTDTQAGEFTISFESNVAPQTPGAIPPLLEGAFAAILHANWAEGEIRVLEAKIDADRYALAAGGAYRLDDKSFALDVDLTGDTLETGHPTADLLLRGPVRMSGSLAGRSFDKLSFKAVEFTSPALEARIDGDFDRDGGTELGADVVIPELGLLHEAAQGRVVLQARLSGPFEALKVDFAGRGEHVTVAGRALNDLTLAVSGIVSDAVPHLDFALEGALADEPIRLTATLTGDETGTLRVGDISGRVGAAEIAGQIAMGADGVPEGSLTLEVPNLADLSDPALRGIRGSLAADITLTAEDGKPGADIRIEGANLARDDMRADWFALRARASDIFGDTRLSGSGLLQGTAVGETALGNLAFEVAGEPQDAYRLTVREAGGRWTVRALTKFVREDAVALVRVDTLQATLAGVDMELARATALRIAPDGVSLDRTELVAGNARLLVEGTISPAMDLRADLDRLPLEFVNAALPDLGLRGQVSGTIVATGSDTAPVVRIKLSGSGVSTGDLRALGLPAVSIELDGTVENEVLALRGQIRDAAVTLSFNGSVGLAGRGRVDLALAGELPSEVLAEMGAENDIVVRSTATVDLRLQGRLDDVSYSGTVTTSGATFGDAGGRLTVRDVTARLVIDGDVARIEQFSGATAGGDGRVTVTGTVGLSDNAQVNLNINVTRGRYIDGTLFVTLFDAALTLRGPLTGGQLVLAGTIDLIQPKVTLSELPPASLTPLEVEHTSASSLVLRQQQALVQSRDAASSLDMAIDVEIRVADRILVNGRGINAELNGALRLTGPIASPGAFGSFRLVRGSVDVLGTKVDFNVGELDFIGNLNPQIRFSGAVRASGTVITLSIAGPADAPQLTITSVPDLPQEEALALLIFGRATSELSPLQVAQLAASVALLSGGSGGGLFDSLQDLLGGTTVEVVRTEEGETAVNVGQQLTDQLSVGVQQETGTGVRRVIIDLEITDNLILRGSVGEDRSTKTGIFFETEY